MNLQHLFLIFVLFIVQFGLGVSQSYPETLNVTGFPSQDKIIYSGWIVGDTPSGSLYYYNLFTKDGTDLNLTDPLVIYLEGGPGYPSTMTAFSEIGPYLATSADSTFQNFTVIPNPNSWTKNYNVLVIDNPLGTGFSVLKNNYTVNTTDQAADNLITFLNRFFHIYSPLVNSPTYLYGRSYGAKFASTLAYKWLQTNAITGVPLYGLILADGVVDPLLQLTYSESAFSFGVIDWSQKQTLADMESNVTELINNNDLVNASLGWKAILDYLQNPNVTGGMWRYNYIQYSNPIIGFPAEYLRIVSAYRFISSPNSLYRTIFQIPDNLNYTQVSPLVTLPLQQTGDFANSTKYAVEYVLGFGRDVLIFTGQFDPVVNYVGMMNYVQALNWTGTETFLNSTKNFLTVNNHTAGAYQKQDNLVVAVINKAGHLVTFDQPESVLTLLDGFINDTL